MNKNDKKSKLPAKKREKGLVDPHSIKEWEVYKETTLLEFLAFKMPDTPRKTLKSLLSHHQVAVGGVPTSQFDAPLYPEDVVTVSKNRIAKHERKDLPIIFEDQDLIVINKPSGLLSVATEREKGRTAYRLVSDYVMAKSPKDRIFVVHRLDEDTSGVLVFAKNYQTREALQNSWQSIVKDRAYYAIVEGKMEKDSDTLKDYLAQDNFQLVYVTKDKAKGKLAITSYKVVKERGPYTLLDIHIESGRKNQIRVQLGHIGHYVIGDDKYGEPTDPLKRLGLHAYKLTFTNPLNGKEYDFVAPMPIEFKKLVFSDNAKFAKQKAKMAEHEAKKDRDTRAETKIKKGKQRAAASRRFGEQKPQQKRAPKPHYTLRAASKKK